MSQTRIVVMRNYRRRRRATTRLAAPLVRAKVDDLRAETAWRSASWHDGRVLLEAGGGEKFLFGTLRGALGINAH